MAQPGTRSCCSGEFQPQDIMHAHAAVAAGQVVELEQEGVEQHAEGERQHAEENAGIAHAQRADRQRAACRASITVSSTSSKDFTPNTPDRIAAP